MFFDVTVRHGVPGDAGRLAAAALHSGAVNREAEADKRARYPDDRAPWRAVPLATETYGRLGLAALAHLRRLARQRAALLAESDAGTVGAVLLRRGCRLSVAAARSGAARLRGALGTRAAAADAGAALREAVAG